MTCFIRQVFQEFAARERWKIQSCRGGPIHHRRMKFTRTGTDFHRHAILSMACVEVDMAWPQQLRPENKATDREVTVVLIVRIIRSRREPLDPRGV